MLQLRLVILSLLICSGLFAIEKKKQTNFNVSVNSFLSSGEDLPFWITSNRNGVFSLKNSNYQLLQAGFTRELEIKSIRKWDYTWGLNLVSGFGGKTDFQANQYWFGLRRKWFVIKAGAQSDPILYEGLSSTNGNLDRSNNARPLPGITFSTNDYIPFFFWKSWFTFNAKFEEKLFSKHTFVNDAHLHHKSLYLRASLPKNWSVTGGFEHFVLWGGTSPTVEGKMPGFDQYFRYILAQKAGPGALKDDQKNKSGNQLGLYSLEIKKEWSKSSIAFYWNHPFEDLSGITLVNWRDGLWGLHLNNKNQSALITDVVYEYMYTLHQSGPDHLIPAPTPDDPSRLTGRGKDNYFDSYIYRSFAYYNRMMGTPLFVPRIGENGMADGFESTRMWMHHIGIKGSLGSGLYWKSMLTWSRNFGTYPDSFPWSFVLDPIGGGSYAVPLDEFSFLWELNYKGNKLPFEVNAGIAGDYGTRFEKRIGGYAGICFRF